MYIDVNNIIVSRKAYIMIVVVCTKDQLIIVIRWLVLTVRLEEQT